MQGICYPLVLFHSYILLPYYWKAEEMFVIFSLRDASYCAHNKATVILTATDDRGLIISDHLKT